MNIYEYKDYKRYLNDVLDMMDGSSRGARSKLSKFIGCQTAFMAQVLRGNLHFNLEQAELIGEFVGLSEAEGSFLIMLILYQRAGTEKLKARFDKQIESLANEHSKLTTRLLVSESIEKNHQDRYFSTWYYSAIHALISIPEFNSDHKMIAGRLGLSVKAVADALEFLVKAGVIKKAKAGRYETQTSQIHLSSDSDHITKHHTNWRIKALQSFDSADSRNMHYSSVVSVSAKDLRRIRENLISTIKEVKTIVKDSREEELVSLCLDWFIL